MSTYTDPARLFTIRVPEGFTRDPRAKSLVFRHDELDGAVTVSCLRQRMGDATVSLFDALPSRDNMDNIARSRKDGTDVVYGDYQGELQNEPEYWRWWTLQRGPVGIVVSFNGSPDSAPGQVDELVDGIRISEHPPMGIEDFTQLAATVYAASLGKPKPDIIRPLELSTGGKSVLRLDNAYASYLDNWDVDAKSDPAALLQEWFERLWGEQAETLGPFEETRGLIYPVVKPWGFGRETKIAILRRTIVERELEMLAAVDTGRTLRFLSKEDLDRWEGVSEEDVFFYARENLTALSQDMELQSLADADGTPRAVIIASGDSHDAARLMLPELYTKLADVLGPNLLVGVPNRDFMIILTADDAELVSNVSAQVKVDAETRAYPISGKLYRLTKEGVEPS
jgi:hypothetical protein